MGEWVSEPAEFDALIKKIEIKSLVSGDKEAQILLQFQPTNELLDSLNKLHRADDLVNVKIEENV